MKREKDISIKKEAGESVISTEYLSVSVALGEQSAEIQNRSSLSSEEDTQTGITQFRRMSKTQIK